MNLGQAFQNLWNGTCSAAKGAWDWTCEHSKELAGDAVKIGIGVGIVAAGIAIVSASEEDDSDDEEDVIIEIED